jgi:four helix bundle protein
MTSMVRSFHDLKVWQLAMELVPEAYQVARGLPAVERFELASQIRRAAVSIPANIAEGQARQHTREFVQHLSIARGSLAELQTLLLLAERLGYVQQDALSSCQKMIPSVRMMLSGLLTRLQERG